MGVQFRGIRTSRARAREVLALEQVFPSQYSRKQGVRVTRVKFTARWNFQRGTQPYPVDAKTTRIITTRTHKRPRQRNEPHEISRGCERCAN